MPNWEVHNPRPEEPLTKEEISQLRWENLQERFWIAIFDPVNFLVELMRSIFGSNNDDGPKGPPRIA